MSKQKEKSEVEYLRAENKKMKSEIKQLKKTVARFSKRSHQLEDLEERIIEQDLKEKEEQFIEVVPDNKCIKCSSGTLEETKIGEVRIIINCSNCDFREIKKV